MMGGMAQAWSDDDDDGEEREEEVDAAAGGAKRKHPAAHTVSSVLNADVLPAGSRILKQRRGKEDRGKPARSKLAALLLQTDGQDEETDDAVTRHLMNLGPPQVDLEMQALCLGLFDDDGVDLLKRCAGYLTRQLVSRRHFEVMQAYLSRFLQIYSTMLLEAGPKVRAEVQALREAQTQANRQMKELVQHNLCLLGFFANLKQF